MGKHERDPNDKRREKETPWVCNVRLKVTGGGWGCTPLGKLIADPLSIIKSEFQISSIKKIAVPCVRISLFVKQCTTLVPFY